MSETRKMSEVLDESLKLQIEEAYEEILGDAKISRDQDHSLKKLRRMQFTDEVIELAFQKYKESSFGRSKNSILQGERYNSRMNWYCPMIEPRLNLRF